MKYSIKMLCSTQKSQTLWGDCVASNSHCSVEGQEVTPQGEVTAWGQPVVGTRVAATCMKRPMAQMTCHSWPLMLRGNQWSVIPGSVIPGEDHWGMA